jgi:hypothetical protein
MAEIWPVYEGSTPTGFGPWAKLPLDEAIHLCELKPRGWFGELSQEVRFGASDRDLTIFGYKNVVVVVGEDEARSPWRAGFYRSPVKPAAMFDRILKRKLAGVLGEDKVLRVEHGYYLDSGGRSSFKAMVVLPPSVEIGGDLILQANSSLQEFASDTGMQGTPILQYATEDELIQTDE